MNNCTKWMIGRITRIGRAVYSLIKQIRHVPARIVCDMPDGRSAVILADDHEYRIYIIDKEAVDSD